MGTILLSGSTKMHYGAIVVVIYNFSLLTIDTISIRLFII